MKKKSAVAAAKFIEGYNCAQAVLYSFCDELKLDKNLALKMVCGFGAGMGRKEEVCGAVTGGIVVIGTHCGRGENESRESTELTYNKTRELMDRFTEKHGTYICRKLIDDCELTSDEGQRQFKENDMLNKICKPCVQSVVEILETIV